MKRLLLALLLCGAAAHAAPKNVSPKTTRKTTNTPTRDAARTSARQIRARLPQDWRVTYHEGVASVRRIEIARGEHLLIEPPDVFNASPRDNRSDVLSEFALVLSVEPFVAPDDVLKLQLKNDSTRFTMDKLRRELKRRGVPRKFDAFRPRTPEEKAQTDRYNRLKSSLHRLPEFYFGDIGLDRFNYGALTRKGSPLGSELVRRIRDEAVRQECAQVCARIESLLQRYEPATAQTTE